MRRNKKRQARRALRFPQVITADWLDGAGACSDEIRLFNAAFPKGAEITVNNILKAAEADISIGWIVHVLENYRIISHQRRTRFMLTLSNCKDRYKEAIGKIRDKYVRYHESGLRDFLLRLEKSKYVVQVVEIYVKFFRSLDLLRTEVE
jgi:hypothetical protein